MPPEAATAEAGFVSVTTDPAREALNAVFAVASVGIATLRLLETLLPRAAAEVEEKSKELSAYFHTLAQSIDKKPVPAPVAEAINGIVTTMQFQDRNSQVMKNAITILERYRGMLEDIRGDIEISREGRAMAEHDVSDAVQYILEGIRLGDVRSSYVEALKKAQLHKGEDETSGPGGGTDDIELF